MCGPTGVGILYGKKEILAKMKPLEFGGDMIDEVSYQSSTFRSAPYKFEAGTPNIADVIAFGNAIDYLIEIDIDKIEEYENILNNHFLKRIKEVKDLDLYGPKDTNNRGSVFAFNIKGIHAHDVGAILDKYGIASRSGHHCVMPLHTKLGIVASCRISFYFYNTLEEVDYIINILKKLKKEFEKGEFLLK
jgi:cysteine desulfurase/selenocysteine lyase